MSYKKAQRILPMDVLELIQEYVDGEMIYIPRKNENRKDWGTSTRIRQELEERNIQIYLKHKEGVSTTELAEQYYLSSKSIQRIILIEKNKNI